MGCAKMSLRKYVTLFQDRYVEMFQRRNVKMFPEKFATKFQEKFAEMFQERNVSRFLKNSAKMFQEKYVRQSVRIFTGAKCVPLPPEHEVTQIKIATCLPLYHSLLYVESPEPVTIPNSNKRFC